MEDDLRGLDLPAGPHGVKRRRADLSDGEDSDGEPTPKRDRLLEELSDLLTTDQVEDDLVRQEDIDQEWTTPVELEQIRQPVDNQNLPLRPHPRAKDAPSVDERFQQLQPQRAVSGGVMQEEHKVSRD